MARRTPTRPNHARKAVRAPIWERVEPAAAATFVAIAGVVLFVFWQMQPSLIFADTTPAGGDMGAHVWLPAFLRDHLIPHGRLTGWTPDWYAGFPALTFYFPLPSLLIVLLDVVLPYGVAFKLVSISGLLALPVAAWAFGRLAGMRFPGPACLAVSTLLFLFDRSFTIYGGNIPSTLAGEFAFSISLALCLVFLGVVARGLDTGKHRALAAGLLALTALCHVIPTFFAIAGSVVMLIFRLDRRRLWWLLSAGLVAGMVAAFWVMPFLMRIAYTNDMGWEKIVTYRKDLFPASLRWLPFFAAAGALAAIARRRRTGTTLVLLAAGSALAFVVAPQSRLWNARLLPFWFLCLYLLVGVAVAELAHFIADVREWRAASLAVNEGRARPPIDEEVEHRPNTAELLAPIAALVAALTFVALPLQALPKWFPIKTQDRSFIPDWAKWNYSGYERKPAHREFVDLVATMRQVCKDVGPGRAMWEYERQLDRLGTPMALMLLPHWTDGCIGSMEGLFFESSASTPYHFLNQSELSKAPSRAQRDMPYRELDVDKGVAHLQLMGVRYYMALSPDAKAQAARHPDLQYLASSGPWSVSYDDGAHDRTWDIFEVRGSELVESLEYEPVVMEGVAKGGKEWMDAAVAWYQEESRWPVPLAVSGPKEWARVQGAETDPPREAVRPVRVRNIRTDDDRISFDVDRVGTPVLVKASYFPNWKASGADGPWRVTPNLMVVVPTSKHVELHYGHTPVDLFAWLLTFLGIGTLVWFRRRGPMEFDREPEAVVDAGETPPAQEKSREERVPAPVSLSVPAPGYPAAGGA